MKILITAKHPKVNRTIKKEIEIKDIRDEAKAIEQAKYKFLYDYINRDCIVKNILSVSDGLKISKLKLKATVIKQY